MFGKETQGQRIVRLMDKLTDTEPFFAHLILSMKLVEGKKEVPTMGVDGINLYFNPEFTEKLTDPELIGVLGHEALHVAWLHPLRRGERDPALYNIACDAVINPVLKRHRYVLPADGVDIPVEPHETSEEVYERLRKAGGGGGGGQMPKWGMVLDCKTGEARELTEEEAIEVEKNVMKAAQKAREAGKMPGDYEQIIENTYMGKVDWRDHLRKFLGGGHDRERTWSRPSRRYPDIVMPGMAPYGPGEIVVVIDTSGSIDEKLGQKFVDEVAKINEDMTPEKIHVVCCDARVQWTRTYTGYEAIDQVQFKGRGGTDFRPPFEWVKENNINPKALVYFTDLFCSSYPETPDYPVMWLVWPGGGSGHRFGELIRM